jgi:hypothetical protein
MGNNQTRVSKGLFWSPGAEATEEKTTRVGIQTNPILPHNYKTLLFLTEGRQNHLSLKYNTTTTVILESLRAKNDWIRHAGLLYSDFVS